MRRFFLAGLVGAAVAALAFLAVLAFTDVRVTTETTPTRQQLIQELLTPELHTGRGHVASSKTTTTVAAPPPSRCAVGRQLALRIGEPQGATGVLAIPVGVSLGSGNECILTATARFSIRRAGGGVLTIKGNPQAWHPHGLLTPRRGPSRTFAWGNWCGPEGGFVFELAVNGGGQATVPDKATPRCDSRSAPSTLGRLPGSP
jgi:hypothetical protein